MQPLRPGRRRARPVRGLPGGGEGSAPKSRHGRDLRGARARDRQLAVGGVPFYLRTARGSIRKARRSRSCSARCPYNLFRGTERGPPDARSPDDPRAARRGDLARVEGEDARARARARSGARWTSTTTSRSPRVAEAYERLLLEAMEGDHTLFLREDGVERSWESAGADPASTRARRSRLRRGTWGPPEADALIAPRKWHVTGEWRSLTT